MNKELLIIDQTAWSRDAEALRVWAARTGDGDLMYEACRSQAATMKALDQLYEQVPHGRYVPSRKDLWDVENDRGSHGGYYSYSDSTGRPPWGH